MPITLLMLFIRVNILGVILKDLNKNNEAQFTKSSREHQFWVQLICAFFQYLLMAQLILFNFVFPYLVILVLIFVFVES